jgi:hypothetical protein
MVHGGCVWIIQNLMIILSKSSHLILISVATKRNFFINTINFHLILISMTIIDSRLSTTEENLLVARFRFLIFHHSECCKLVIYAWEEKIRSLKKHLDTEEGIPRGRLDLPPGPPCSILFPLSSINLMDLGLWC